MIKCFLRIQFGLCACVVLVSVWICLAITCTFVHGFQNNLAQLLSSRIKSAF